VDYHHAIEAAGIVAFGLVFYSYARAWLDRLHLNRVWRAAVTGLAFGGLAVVLMISRIQISEGVAIAEAQAAETARREAEATSHGSRRSPPKGRCPTGSDIRIGLDPASIRDYVRGVRSGVQEVDDARQSHARVQGRGGRVPQRA
jgi:hypothetical protein